MDSDSQGKLRFSSKGLFSKRQKLGLSAAQAGALMGVSGQSVYKWEQGKAHPRAGQLASIAQLRKMNKKEARAKLDELAH